MPVHAGPAPRHRTHSSVHGVVRRSETCSCGAPSTRYGGLHNAHNATKTLFAFAERAPPPRSAGPGARRQVLILILIPEVGCLASIAGSARGPAASRAPMAECQGHDAGTGVMICSTQRGGIIQHLHLLSYTLSCAGG